MIITSATIEGVSEAPIRHDFGRVTAVVGPNGCGKTRLLRILHRTRELVAPYGASRPALLPFARPDAPGVRAIVGLGFDEQERSRFAVGLSEEIEARHSREGRQPSGDSSPDARAALAHYAHDGAQGFWELVPSDRSSGAAFFDMSADAQRRFRASESPDKYEWLESFFADVALGVAAAEEGGASLLSVNKMFEKARCPLRLDHAKRRGASYAPCFRLFGRAFEGLKDAPSGHRDVALFVALLSLLRPRRSVLLIDDLDRSLDDELREGVLGLVAETPNQIIFTTRSKSFAASGIVTTTISLSNPSTDVGSHV